MIIDCISDLHGEFPKLEGGDLLIVAGDCTCNDSEAAWADFDWWLGDQPYQKKVFIAGNHDNRIVGEEPCSYMTKSTYYLFDSGIEFEGLKIWGSPWTRKFRGQNPKALAFALDNEEQLAEKFKLIPKDTDILITHSPPLDILDTAKENGSPLGSSALLVEVARVRPSLHVFGHIHGAYGIERSVPTRMSGSLLLSMVIFVNASHVNEIYDPVNKPIRILLPNPPHPTIIGDPKGTWVVLPRIRTEVL